MKEDKEGERKRGRQYAAEIRRESSRVKEKWSKGGTKGWEGRESGREKGWVGVRKSGE